MRRGCAPPLILRARAPGRRGATVFLGLAALLGVTLIVFAFFPGIDLAVARFFAPLGHFPPEGTFGRAGRNFFRVTPYLL